MGIIVRRKPSIPVVKPVQSLLYTKFTGSQHTRNGLHQEKTTIEEYQLKMAEKNVNVRVEPMGLVIHQTHRFLAGSPDGLVKVSTGDKGLLEVKNLLHNKPINLWQAAENKKGFCLEIRNGSLHLKENHPYYYQCHGVLNVCGLEWIDFVVRTLNPYQMFIQRIHKDEHLWEGHMLPKLMAFYFAAILPELACPRYGKSPGIREPGIWVCIKL